MEEKNGKLNTDAESIFKRAVGYTYQQVVSEFVKTITLQIKSKKVVNTVTTFLIEAS